LNEEEEIGKSTFPSSISPSIGGGETVKRHPSVDVMEEKLMKRKEEFIEVSSIPSDEKKRLLRMIV
jgi:hypothetical protein